MQNSTQSTENFLLVYSKRPDVQMANTIQVGFFQVSDIARRFYCPFLIPPAMGNMRTFPCNDTVKPELPDTKRPLGIPSKPEAIGIQVQQEACKPPKDLRPSEAKH